MEITKQNEVVELNSNELQNTTGGEPITLAVVGAVLLGAAVGYVVGEVIDAGIRIARS